MAITWTAKCQRPYKFVQNKDKLIQIQLISTKERFGMAGIFNYGRVVITAEALDVLSLADVYSALKRHINGDWSELSEHDFQKNQSALDDGDRLLSKYTSGYEDFWIITESDRSVTTVLLPSDY